MKFSMDSAKLHRDIRTETFMDYLVRCLSVYAVAGIGLFLIVKYFFVGKYGVKQFCKRSI